MYTERFTERWELLDVLYGVGVAANTESNTGYNSAQGYNRLVIIIHPISLNDALDVDIEQGTDTAGTGAKTFDSGGKDIAVATTDTAPSVIEVRNEEFDVQNNFDTINVEVTTANTGGGSNYFAVEIWGLVDYAPASTTNLDSVTD